MNISIAPALGSRSIIQQALPREGIGCWNPVFPARLDDVWMLASIAVKHIEELLKTSVSNYNFTVFEQTYENEAFTGIHQVFFESCQ